MTGLPAPFDLERFTVLANSSAVLTQPEIAGVDPMARRVGCFMVFDGQGRSCAFRDDTAPRIRPDFRICRDPDGEQLLLSVTPVVVGVPQYRVAAADGSLVGELLAEGGGLFARRWRVCEAGGGRQALLEDTDRRASLARRFRTAGARESLRLAPKGGAPAFLIRERRALPYLLRVVSPPDFALDRRLLWAAALCIPAIEGLTDYLSS